MSSKPDSDGALMDLLYRQPREDPSPVARTLEDEDEMKTYHHLCRPKKPNGCKSTEAIKLTASVFSRRAKAVLLNEGVEIGQYAHLGHIEEEHQFGEENVGSYVDHNEDSETTRIKNQVINNGNKVGTGLDYVFMNTNAPWSAFICGSQGSGKSYTTACMLEGFLKKDERIGTLQDAAAVMAFHYDRIGGEDAKPCEIASLCTAGIRVRVLVSFSNRDTMKTMYKKKYPDFYGNQLTVTPLYIRSADLNSERIQKFMATKKGGEKPLYMSILDRVLRDLAREGQHDDKDDITEPHHFDYTAFRNRLEEENFTEQQRESLDQRLSCLESFMKGGTRVIKRKYGIGHSAKIVKVKVRDIDETVEDMLQGQSGSLTLVDLTDSTFDASVACGLFNVCLAAFVGRTHAAKVVALDEAHNYMNQGSTSEDFTEDLLKVIREQRHSGSRVIVATQEPTISPKFLDLCSMTIVHRFTSPDWFRTLRSHLGGASSEAGVSDKEANDLFAAIGDLDVGESMLFCPTALLDVQDGQVKRLHFNRKIVRTRYRISDDAGKSKMAQKSALE